MIVCIIGLAIKMVGLLLTWMKSKQDKIDHESQMKEKAKQMFESDMQDWRLVVQSREKDDCGYYFNRRPFTNGESWLDFELVDVTRFGLVIMVKYNKNEIGIENEMNVLYVKFDQIKSISDTVFENEVVVDLMPWESLLRKFDKYAFADDIVTKYA